MLRIVSKSKRASRLGRDLRSPLILHPEDNSSKPQCSPDGRPPVAPTTASARQARFRSAAFPSVQSCQPIHQGTNQLRPPSSGTAGKGISR